MNTITEDVFSKTVTRALRAAGDNPLAPIPVLKRLAYQHRGNPAAVVFCEEYINDAKGDCAGLVPWAKMHYGELMGLTPKVERVEGTEPGQVAYGVILPHERARYLGAA